MSLVVPAQPSQRQRRWPVATISLSFSPSHVAYSAADGPEILAALRLVPRTWLLQLPPQQSPRLHLHGNRHGTLSLRSTSPWLLRLESLVTPSCGQYPPLGSLLQRNRTGRPERRQD
ncbi:hypothetical protein LY78DRAFT_6339 [Colletotrichum sublineola]|nr:hypothetical protein LY78DRAFT_6339 [Colletotrichum sublineola]